MKLCRLVPDKVEQAESFTRNEPAFELKQYVLFDISRNFYQEDIPSDILKCIRYTKMNNPENQAFIPQFRDMTRKDMQVQLLLSRYPIMLREIIGNRSKMLNMGSNLAS